jgi:hypothetical protein
MVDIDERLATELAPEQPAGKPTRTYVDILNDNTIKLNLLPNVGWGQNLFRKKGETVGGKFAGAGWGRGQLSRPYRRLHQK